MLFLHHISASLLIQENADPAVLHDLNALFPDDMPAHIRAALTATNLSIPVDRGRMDLGRWQGIYLCEHRVRTHERRIMLHLMGD